MIKRSEFYLIQYVSLKQNIIIFSILSSVFYHKYYILFYSFFEYEKLKSSVNGRIQKSFLSVW